MQEIQKLAGPNRTVELFGVRLVGVSAENGKKLLLSPAFMAAVALAGRLAKLALRGFVGEKQGRAQFWTRQATRLRPPHWSLDWSLSGSAIRRSSRRQPRS